MHYHTTPVPTPKPATPSREDALASGELIDVVELESPSPLPLPGALSDALLERIEQVPFADRARASSETRLTGVLCGAKAAFRRAEDHFGIRFAQALFHGFVIDFSARLPIRSDERAYSFVRMHCGPDETGEVVITLALPHEI